MRTNDEGLRSLIRAAVALSQMQTELGALTSAGLEAMDVLDEALGGIDAHDLVMAAPPACVNDGEEAKGRGSDGLLLCNECAQHAQDHGEYVETL